MIILATDGDKLCSMARDTVLHKKLVMDNCLLMAEYLMQNKRFELGTQLLKRGCEHDNSKFDTEEFRKLSQILKAESKEAFTNAAIQLSPDERKAIEYHWEHNRHHPEFFVSPSDEMSELDIMEMVCDWFARSIQYKTDFIPFITERQENRFHFTDKVFSRILKYCNLLQKLYNEANNQTNKEGKT